MSHAMQPFIVGTMLATLLFSGSVLASDEAGVLLLAPSASEEGAPAVLPTSKSNPFGLKAMDSSALAKRRGGDGGISEMQLKGVVADNRAINVNTGNNVISDARLSGLVRHADGGAEHRQQRPHPERHDRQRAIEVDEPSE